MDAKKVLSALSLATTLAGFFIQVISNGVDDKKQEMQIAEAVAKEVARQQKIPMKRGS